MSYPYDVGTTAIGTDANLIVSPFIADYAPDATINVTSEMLETVSLTGVDRVFSFELDLSSSVGLLNSFDVSGFNLDYTQTQEDINVANLSVIVSDTTKFQSILAAAIDGAADSAEAVEPEGAKSAIKTYLETRLRNAIRGVFEITLTGNAWGNSLSGTQTTTSTATLDNITSSPAPLATAGSATEAVAATTMSAVASVEFTGLAVDVDLSENAMAAACANSHNGSVVSLFRQIQKSTWSQYKNTASTRLSTCALPMLKGQELAFAFDIDVAATKAINDAGAPATGQTESVPVAPGQSATYSSMQMNLGNRRVVFRLKLGDGLGGTGPFDVGTNTLTQLRVQTH